MQPGLDEECSELLLHLVLKEQDSFAQEEL